MEKYKVTIKGWGQHQGTHKIDISLEINRNEVGNYQGYERYEYITRTVKYNYPEYDFDVKNLSVKVSEIKPEKSRKTNNINFALGGFLLGKLSNSNKETQTFEKKETKTVERYGYEVRKLSEIIFSENENEISDGLDQIYYKIKAYNWKFTSKSDPNNHTITENNKLLNSCLNNYKYGFNKLKKNTDNIELIKTYKSKLNSLIFKKYIGLYGLLALAFSILPIMILILWLRK